MATLSQDTLKALSLRDVKQLRKEKAQEVEYINKAIHYEEFFSRFLIPNRPCVFGPHITRGWKAVQEWATEDGRPDFDFLNQKFGNAVVPVADCEKVEYSAQPKSDMQLSQYLQYWDNKDVGATESRCLYLKDWHFKKFFPDYEAYETPVFFTSDWMNEYWDNKPGKTADDYRFVYMGPKGSWTPFHADVFRSYSWSANVCGRKRWLLYPPGQEAYLRDRLGNLAYDVTSPELHDEKKYPHYHKACKPFEVIQGPGEVIFVPSGWHHQVFNIEDTISINHNWLNGCNVDITWAFLRQELDSVKKSISDCVGMEGWGLQCQLIMKASTGIDYPAFLQLLWTVAASRLCQLRRFKERPGKCHCSTRPNDERGKTDQMTHKSFEIDDQRTAVGSGNHGRRVQSTQSAERLELSTIEDPTRRNEDAASHPFSSRNNAPGSQTLDVSGKSAPPCSTDSASAGSTTHANPRQPFPQQEKGDGEFQKCILCSTHNPLESFGPLDTGQSLLWHSVFDLRCIREILTSMLADEDFCQIERATLCKDPQQFLEEVISATKDVV